MSALAIGAATIDAAGKNLTLPITGIVSGSLSFTATPTGFFVRGNLGGALHQFTIGTPTISGTNVIVPMLCTVPAGTTGFEVIGFAGNLTDGAGSTAPANTVSISSAPITATPTSSPAYSGSNGGFHGYFAPHAGSPNGMLLSDIGQPGAATYDTVWNVTSGPVDVNFPYYNNNGVSTFSVSIDGGSYVPVPFSAESSLVVGQLATGLGIGIHAISIKFTGTAAARLNTDILFQFFGGNVTQSQPLSTTVPTTGSIPAFWSDYPASAFSQATVSDDTSTVTNQYAPETGTATGASNSNGWELSSGHIFPLIRGSSIGWNCARAATGLRVYMDVTASSTITLRVDNVEVGHLQVSGSGGNLVDLTSLLSGVSAAAHTYHLTFASWGSGQGPALGSVLVTGTTVTTSPPALRDHWIFYGDSIVEAFGLDEIYGVSNPGIVGIYNFCYIIANRLGVAYSIRGDGGTATKYLNGPGEANTSLNQQAGENRTSDVLGCTHPAHTIVENYGSNDIRQSANAILGGAGEGRDYTTTTAAITGTGSAQSIPVVSSAGFLVGQTVQVEIGGPDFTLTPGANHEALPITAIADGTHITLAPTKNHSSGIIIGYPESIDEFQAAYLHMLQQFFATLPSVNIVAIGIIPNQAPDGAFFYGETQDVINSTNIAAWNARKVAAFASLTAPQQALCRYISPVGAGLNGTTNPNYDAYGGAPVNYTTNYVPASGDTKHPGVSGNALLGNYIYSVLSASSSIFRTAGSQFHARKGSRQLANN